MNLSKEDVKVILKRIIKVKTNLVKKQPFYGILLMYMRFSLDFETETAYTDGNNIAFSPSFVKELSDSELEFVLMHEIMHVALLHVNRTKEKYNNYLFNIACDIVVNSNILKSNNNNLISITLSKFGEAMHKAPNGKEGYEYTAEQVYQMLLNNCKKINNQSIIDDHSHWGRGDLDAEVQKQVWAQRVKDAALKTKEMGFGNLPLGLDRQFKLNAETKLDWRRILIDFIQCEINDYSFMQVDNRYFDSPFFLPSFSEKDEQVKNILFMVDTSGSISDEDLTMVLSEIQGALEQFNGKIEGLICFFDTDIYGPLKIDGNLNLSAIKAKGGGGTSFVEVFKCVEKLQQDIEIESLIILTDGYASFPSKEIDVETLWIINNNSVNPPFGKVTRLIEDE